MFPRVKLGDHALCCGMEGERILHHNAINNALYTTLAVATPEILLATVPDKKLLANGQKISIWSLSVFLGSWIIQLPRCWSIGGHSPQDLQS